MYENFLGVNPFQLPLNNNSNLYGKYNSSKLLLSTLSIHLEIVEIVLESTIIESIILLFLLGSNVLLGGTQSASKKKSNNSSKT